MIAATRQRARRRQHDDTNRQPGSMSAASSAAHALAGYIREPESATAKRGDLCDRAALQQTQSSVPVPKTGISGSDPGRVCRRHHLIRPHEGAAAGGAGWFYLFQAGVIEGAGCPAMAGLSIAAKLQDGGCLATVGALHTVWHRHWRELPERKWARLGEARSPVFCTRVYQRPVDYCSFIAAPAARRCTGRGMMVVRGGGSDCR